jgi:aspartate/methionine/tyrosine aminotransferase
LSELLALADEETRALWDGLRLGYTESQGHPLLRNEAARLYRTVGPEQVLIAAPEELIFLAMNALLEPADHVIVTQPAYQSLHAVAEALGCRVTRWPLRLDEGRWRLDLDFLADHITGDTRLIVINFPHNPTGALIDPGELDAIIALARGSGAYLFSDEMYRLLELDRAARLPAVCDLYERGLTLSGLSKAFGLPGLRVGWLALRAAPLMARLCALHDYTTICNGAPGEILGVMALRAGETITGRNRALVGANLALADAFFTKWEAVFRWLPPAAGSVAFPQWLGAGSVEAFCEDVLRRESVLLLPGSVFEAEGDHFRIGLGRRDFPVALGRLDAYLAASASHAGQRLGSASS